MSSNLGGRLHSLKLGASTLVCPPLPKILQTVLLGQGWNQIKSHGGEGGISCLNCTSLVRLTCALSNWSLSISHVQTRVPVRPDTTAKISICAHVQFEIVALPKRGITFPAFAVNSDDVLGISRHPLPHTRGVFQHVPETHTRDIKV